jgi:hypothetical protein
VPFFGSYVAGQQDDVLENAVSQPQQTAMTDRLGDSMNVRSARLLGSGALLALLVAGCGGSTDETTSTITPPSATNQTTQTLNPDASVGGTTTTTVAVPGS